MKLKYRQRTVLAGMILLCTVCIVMFPVFATEEHRVEESGLNWELLPGADGGYLLTISGNGRSEIPAEFVQNIPKLKKEFESGTIHTVEIGNGIIRIGDSAFYNLQSLEYLTFTEDNVLEAIGGAAFAKCANLTVAELHKCTKLKRIENNTIPNNGMSGAFACTGLTKINLPKNMELIGVYGFYECNNLTEVNLSDIQQIGNMCFYHCDKLKKITLNEIEGIGGSTFYNCSQLEEVSLSNIGEVGDSAFLNCINLQKLTIENADYLALRAFKTCTNLKNVKFTNILKIGSEVFKDAFQEVNEFYYTQEMFPGLQTVGGYTFSGTGIENLVIGEGMPLENYLFANHTNLKTVLLKSNWDTRKKELFNGTSSKFDATIASCIDLFYGENLQTLAPYTQNLYFQGSNFLTITGVEGGNGFSEPLNDLNGHYYADEHGVLYLLNDDETAVLVYCPPGVEEYQSLQEILSEDGNRVWKVTSIKENALFLAKNLNILDGEKIDKIEDSPEEQGKDQKYELPDTGRAKRETLVYTIPETGQNAQNVMQINTSAESSYRTQNETGNTFDYYTGEYNDTVITVSPGDASGIENCIMRIYLACSANKLEFAVAADEGGEEFYIDGNRFVRKYVGNGVYYIDLPVLTGADTLGFPLNFRYPSPDSGGGVVYLWGRILTKEKAEEERMDLESGAQVLLPEKEAYHKLIWETRPDEFAVKNDVISKIKIKPYEGVAVVADADLRIGAIRTNESTQLQNIGKDYVTKFIYKDVITLPKGIQWDPEIYESIKSGNYHITDQGISVSLDRNDEKKAYVFIEITVSEELTGKLKTQNLKISHIEKSTLELSWNVENISTTDMGEKAEAEIPVIDLRFGDEVMQADFQILEYDSSVSINHQVTMTPEYTYQKSGITSETAAELQVELTKGNVILTETHNRPDTIYWGDEIEYIVKITNDSVVEASGLLVLEDYLNSYQYISAKNLEKMFLDDTEQKMTVQIINATLYKLPKQKEGLYAVNGTTPVKISAQNTGAGVENFYNGLYDALDEDQMFSKGTATITFQWIDKTLTLNVSDNQIYTIGENEDYRSIEDALNGIGYVPLDYGNNRYSIFWDCSDVSLEPGESREYRFKATVKDSFMLLSKDRIGKNDVITSIVRNCTNQVVLKNENNREIATASISKQAAREIEFNMDAMCEGKVLSKDFNVKEGQVIDYTASFQHLGKGQYDTLPVVVRLHGANLLLVKLRDNPKASIDWGKELPIKEINGESYYLLNKEGTYRNVKIGAYQAAEITVKKSDLGIETLIHWYFVNTPMKAYTMNVNYQAYISKEYAGIESSVFKANCESWLNDHQSHRLYASIHGDGSVISADKYIVTSNGERLKHLELEPHSPEVSYELRLTNEGATESLINGKDLYDALPQTYGCFVWGEGQQQIEVTYSKNVLVQSPDSWCVKKEAPVSQKVKEGQYYLCWNENFEAKIPGNETLVIRVTLHYPTDEEWDMYASACNGRMLYNDLYIYHMSAQVSHGIKGRHSVKLQKGVYDIATMAYQAKSKAYRQMPYISTGSRHLYGNLSSRGYIVTYYVTLYNDGTNRLYLNPLMDDLPSGFRLLNLAVSSSIADRVGCLGRYSYLRTTDASTITCRTEQWSDPNDQPLANIDSENIKYISTDVTVTVAAENSSNFDLEFTFAGGDLEDGEHYDAKRELYYLLPGEAIRFGYCADTNSSQMTEDQAVNTILMPFLDYTKSGGNISIAEPIPVNAGLIPENQGDCRIVSDKEALKYGFVRTDNDLNNQWLFSQVTVSRGNILPGIRKTAVHPSAKINETVSWELTAYNDGDYPMQNYIITDEMEAPYKFTGEVFYEISATKGMQEPIIIGALEKEGPLFTIVSNDLNNGESIVLKDNMGTRIVLDEKNAYTATLNCAFLNWYQQDYVTEQGNYRIKIKVSFEQKENGNQLMSITFEDLYWGIPEKGYAKLKLQTHNASGTYFNKVFYNTSWLTPLGEVNHFQPNPIHGNYTFLERNGVSEPSVQSNGIVNVSSGFSTISEKRVTEINHQENVTASTNEVNYIILNDKQNIIRYELEVQTPKEQPMHKFVLIDNLPQEGDYGTFGTTTQRHSEFMVELAEEPKIQVMIQTGTEEAIILKEDQYKIGYSEKTVEKFSDSESVFGTEDWNGNSSWSSELEEFIDENNGKNKVRSIRLVIGDTSLLKKNSVIVFSFDTVIKDENALPGESAWNSFGYHYEIQQGSGKTISLEAASLPAGIKLPDVPKLKKELKDSNGSSFFAEKEETFSYILYKGSKKLNIQDKSLAEIQKVFKENGITEFFIKDVTVQKGQESSEIIPLIPEKWYCLENHSWSEMKSSWEWEDSMQYTIIEQTPASTSYKFHSTNHSTEPCYTFVHQTLNSPLIINVNCKNTEKYLLPESGGTGNGTFILAGVILICVSIIIIRRERGIQMKIKEKLTSFLLVATILMLTIAFPAKAADVNIVISKETLQGHTFKAYQIFTGTQTGEAQDTALGDVVWGSGVEPRAFLDTLTDPQSELREEFLDLDYSTDENLASAAAEVAKILENWEVTGGQADLFAKYVYHHICGDGIALTEITNSLEEGYYLIVDSTEILENGDAYNAALLQVTGDTIEISEKTDAPVLEKKVKENVKYHESVESTAIEGVVFSDGYNDVADYSIGDEIPFVIYSKVPDMKYYDTYQVEIHDNLGEGLSLIDEELDGFEVTIGEKRLQRDSDYAVEKTEHSFVLSIADLKAISAVKKDDLIIVNYSACLNQNAVTGNAGNTNEAYLVYSNHPNDKDSIGRTPTEKTIVFTYELDVLKVDGNSFTENTYRTKLANAEFVLYQMDDEVKKYVSVDSNGKVRGWTELKPAVGNLKTKEDGTFQVTGLDDGIYYLEEITAPSGYNLLRSPVKITVAAATVHGQEGAGTENLSDLMVKVDANLTDNMEEENGMSGDVSNGNVTVIVENYKGAVLPSTGDRGTAFIYGFGTVLIGVSFLYFIISKRNNTK